MSYDKIGTNIPTHVFYHNVLKQLLGIFCIFVIKQMTLLGLNKLTNFNIDVSLIFGIICQKFWYFVSHTHWLYAIRRRAAAFSCKRWGPSCPLFPRFCGRFFQNFLLEIFFRKIFFWKNFFREVFFQNFFCKQFF